MSPGSESLASVGPGAVFVLLLLAAGSALFLARLYEDTELQPSGGGLRVAFPLLAVSLTALFLTVQLSLPLSLGLLAALTVVRFRTPVKEPEEIAFVVAVVSVSALIATLRLTFAGVLLSTAVLAVFATKAMRARQRAAVHGLLLVSLPAARLVQGAIPRLNEFGCRLQSITFAGAEAVLAFRFAAHSESRIRAVERHLAQRLPLARATVLVDSPEVRR
jgi:hypothetical protein